ncbi:DUF502 domain-containing protein [Haloglomus litoreum]|uniref:DUF502 domain-containing protein n=1 Tax=Haloglomus litoreum TaxID=3034026 RepID=UPI0023E7FB13|nr:DUF502 domain-containing protein [Haloglomus sp. DT116]
MSLGSELRDGFVTGILIVAPLAVTVFVVQFVVRRLSGVLDPVVAALRLGRVVNDAIAARGLALVVLVVGVTLLGLLASYGTGRRLVNGIDRAVSLVPLVSVVYTGVRQVSNALSEGDTRFRRVVVVEYPRLDVYSMGFVTADAPAAADAAAGEETSTVIVPHSPNPTAGHLIFVPDDRLHETDLSVSQAVRLLVTTGVAESEEEFEEMREDLEGEHPSIAD